MSTKISKITTACVTCVLWTAIIFAQPAHAKINVVVSIKPIHSLVAGIMQGVDRPTLLLQAGSPHHYALKPTDARALQTADIVIWVGPLLERFLVEPLKTLADKASIITLEKAPDLSLYNVRNDLLQLEAPDHHAHANDPSQLDQHIWLDPLNAKIIVSTISAALQRLDPNNAAIYQRNTTSLEARLSTLNNSLKRQLIPLKGLPFLTFHDAYQYFEKRYHLNMKGSIAINAEKQPGARHLKALQTLIKDQKITCVFREPQFRSSLVDLLIEGTKARTAILDPLGAHIKKGPEQYFSLLKNNAQAFLSCLGKQ